MVFILLFRHTKKRFPKQVIKINNKVLRSIILKRKRIWSEEERSKKRVSSENYRIGGIGTVRQRICKTFCLENRVKTRSINHPIFYKKDLVTQYLYQKGKIKKKCPFFVVVCFAEVKGGN